MSGNLTSLIKSGFDAFNNLWDVDITLPAALTGQSTSIGSDISLRTSSFEPPKFSLKTYKISYKGIELERLSSTLEYKDNRELNLTFRVDGDYGLLEKLQSWKQLYYNPSNDGNIRFGMYSSAENIGGVDPYGVVTVKAYRSVNPSTSQGLTLNDLVSEENADATDFAIKWTFKEVVLLDVNVEPYTREGDSKAQEVKCLFIYGNVEEPFKGENNALNG